MSTPSSPSCSSYMSFLGRLWADSQLKDLYYDTDHTTAWCYRFSVVSPVEGHTKLQLEADGLQMLRRLRGPVAPVVVIGPYRSGKSFLLNQILGVSCGMLSWRLASTEQKVLLAAMAAPLFFSLTQRLQARGLEWDTPVALRRRGFGSGASRWRCSGRRASRHCSFCYLTLKALRQPGWQTHMTTASLLSAP